jgi:hypothetical protein
MPSQGFVEALKVLLNLKKEACLYQNILTLIDFSLSSNKRLWVIDLNSNIVLFNSLVAPWPYG